MINPLRKVMLWFIVSSNALQMRADLLLQLECSVIKNEEVKLGPL